MPLHFHFSGPASKYYKLCQLMSSMHFRTKQLITVSLKLRLCHSLKTRTKIIVSDKSSNALQTCSVLNYYSIYRGFWPGLSYKVAGIVSRC